MLRNKTAVLKLLKQGMRVRHISDFDGASPIHRYEYLTLRAAEVGDIEIAEILLDHDADIEALNY